MPDSLAFAHNNYAEWYANTLKIPNSPTRRYHETTYGPSFNYYDFVKPFNKALSSWQPDAWADVFKQSGAKYVVLTAKHHDGFTLWPSAVSNPTLPTSSHVARDVVGDLTRSVQTAGLKMGLYYSGGLDWTFDTIPLTQRHEFATKVLQSAEYEAYANAQYRELINRYKPSILWNDIGYPKQSHLREMLAYYYNTVPDGVVNNRFGKFGDFTTPEYQTYPTSQARK